MRSVHPPASRKRINRMKSSLFGLAAVILVMLFLSAPRVVRAEDGGDDPLASYRDKHRVLLLFAPNEQDSRYQGQRKLWKGEEAGFKERQLLVLSLLADSKSTAPATLGKRFGVDPKTFTVILVGKDGHNAYQNKEPVTAEAVYHRIDAMPMRREEMRRPKDKA